LARSRETARRSPRQEPPISRDSSLLLLRIAAFLIDAVSAAVILIPPAALASYAVLWLGLSMRPISWIWWAALLLFLLFILFRDARGRSMGKRVMAVRIDTAAGRPVGWLKSALRNLPLVVPVWNLLEVGMVVFASGGRRSGDMLARTTISEE
jgi:uncharacterized RDD family membrane protein YckC